MLNIIDLKVALMGAVFEILLFIIDLKFFPEKNKSVIAKINSAINFILILNLLKYQNSFCASFLAGGIIGFTIFIICLFSYFKIEEFILERRREIK